MARTRRRKPVDLNLAPSSQSSEGTTEANTEFTEVKSDRLTAETMLGFCCVLVLG